MRWSKAMLAPAIVLAAVMTMGAGRRNSIDTSMPLLGEDGLGQEPMPGPDAWDAFGMGRGGLVVPYGTHTDLLLRTRWRTALEQRLGLTDAQRARLGDLRAAARRVSDERDEALRLAHAVLLDRLQDEPPNRVAIDRAAERVSRLEAAALRARVQLAIDERAVLTAAQRRKLR